MCVILLSQDDSMIDSIQVHTFSSTFDMFGDKDIVFI